MRAEHSVLRFPNRSNSVMLLRSGIDLQRRGIDLVHCKLTFGCPPELGEYSRDQEQTT